MKAIHLEPGQPARLVDIQTTSYRHLAQIFPDSFDGIREVAEGIGATWAPKPGTVAAAAPEQEPQP